MIPGDTIITTSIDRIVSESIGGKITGRMRYKTQKPNQRFVLLFLGVADTKAPDKFSCNQVLEEMGWVFKPKRVKV